MCQALPGLRCASSLTKVITRMSEDSRVITEELNTTYANASEETRASEGFRDAYNRKKDGLEALNAKLKTAREHYTMSEAGRKELQERIDHFKGLGDYTSSEMAQNTLKRANEKYDNFQMMAKNQRAEMDRMSEVINDPANQNANFLKAAQESLKKVHYDIADTPRVASGSFDYLARARVEREKLVELGESSSNLRTMAGQVALEDDRYEPGLYGVFHAHDGSMYLSKVVNEVPVAGGGKVFYGNDLTFENRETNTRSNEYDRSLVLVEKTNEGYTYASKFQEKAKRKPIDAVKSMGSVSQNILKDTPPESHYAISSMARQMEQIVVANERADDGEIHNKFLSDIPAHNDHDRGIRDTLLKAYRYARFSPRADRLRSMTLFESTEQLNRK